jgi:alpha-maltose-1-phosphate synthase
MSMPAANCKTLPRVAGILVGDMTREMGARVKYGHLFAALARQVALVGPYDATLRGLARAWNALCVFQPDFRQWQARFYKNVPAFIRRSERAVELLKRESGKMDLIFQVGAMFDARWNDFPMRSVIYTDYTAVLSARHPQGGRSPLTPEQYARWLALEKQAYQRATYIFTRGEFVRRSMIEDYDIDPEKVTSVGGGINFEQLPAVPERSGAAPTFLFIGKEFYRKGGDLLLQAFARARAACPSACLLLLTADALPDDLPRAGVELLPPSYDREFIASLYRRADVFVLPSRLETWGDVLLEAMAFGLPCIGVSGEAMSEIIDDGKNGFVVPAGDVEALAAAIGRLSGDNNLRVAMGRMARQKAESTYTWDHIVSRMVPLIQRIAQTGEVE